MMSIGAKRHELWCTDRDMRLSKCSIIIINASLKHSQHWKLYGFPARCALVNNAQLPTLILKLSIEELNKKAMKKHGREALVKLSAPVLKS